ncbi:hypothetical protein C8J56DRAFT_1061373 [Mycena floridula]|nr:hypothetical protein C8J56DRAFT_1061373 [Mycena floridula]
MLAAGGVDQRTKKANWLQRNALVVGVPPLLSSLANVVSKNQSLHQIFSAFKGSQFNHEQLQLYGELKSLETTIWLLGRLHSQNNSILLSLNSELKEIATKMKKHRDDPSGSWLFNADHQPNILSMIAKLQSSLLVPNGGYMISGTVAVKDSTFGLFK